MDSMGQSNDTLIRPPLIGLGGSSLGSLQGNRVPRDEEVEESYDTAWAEGIRFFDTAPLYDLGSGEERLGKWLRGRSRSTYYLSTKVGSYGQLAPQFDYSYEGTLESVAASMERLGTDRFDAIFIHDIDPYNHGRRQWKSRFSEAMDGAYPALSRLKAEGAVRALGVGVNSCEVCEQCIAIADFDVFMLAGKLTPLDHSANSTLTSLCSRKDIIIIAAAPFNSGILAAGSRSKALYKEARPPSVILTKVRKLEAVCGEFGVSLGALALQFPLRQPAVASVLPGPRNSRQIREVCRWFAEEIPAALWSRLDSDPEFSGEAIVGGHGS